MGRGPGGCCCLLLLCFVVVGGSGEANGTVGEGGWVGAMRQVL